MFVKYTQQVRLILYTGFQYNHRDPDYINFITFYRIIQKTEVSSSYRHFLELDNYPQGDPVHA